MKIIKPSFEIEDAIDEISGFEMLKKIERAGRVCYKSEDRITDDSVYNFIKGLIKSGHESVLEHEKITVTIICDRAIANEIVRHRIGSYSQESTRYCNYAKDKFGKEITVIEPCFFSESSQERWIWRQAMIYAETMYFSLLDKGATPEQARCVLPMSLKTEIAVTFNLREWRHFFKLRTDKAAHPQMREITVPMLTRFKQLVPIVFEGINVKPLPAQD